MKAAPNINAARSPHVTQPKVSKPGFPPTKVVQRTSAVAPTGGRVIQAKGKLRVVKTSELDNPFEAYPKLADQYFKSRYVNMHWRGVSTNTPLYSDCFANCLGVVIHNQEKDFGTLMHFFPALFGGGNKDTLFYAVNKELRRFVSSNHYIGGNLEMLLCKGISWTRVGNKNIKENDPSYADYLAQKHTGRFANITDMMDKQEISIDSSAMLYVPDKGIVYLLDRKTEAKLHELKRDTKSVKDFNFRKFETYPPDYYAKRQQLKQTKLNTIKEFISKLEPLSIEELQKLLRENIGHGASEERERAAIYLLEKKQNPHREPRPPRVKVTML